ncbi:MAG: GNAT family N-acetyltransferase [Deltaproteobacteria bacterium]|nr:MAG: GNAT family N-acetyltransferase [Deltaproteobacteria bacterium]
MTSTSDFSLIRVTSSKDDDFKKIVELDQTEFSRPWSDASWMDVFEGETKQLFCLKRGDSLIGHTLWQLSKLEELAHLLKIQVAEEFKGQGHGYTLLIESENLLISNNFKKFYLEVESENTPAIHLYNKCSYLVVHSRKSYYDDGRDALFMSKDS